MWDLRSSDQGSNQHPQQRKHDLNQWTSREVPKLLKKEKNGVK